MTEVIEGKTFFLTREELCILLGEGQISLGNGTFLVLKGGGFEKTAISEIGNAFHSLISTKIGKVFKNAFIVPVEKRE